MLYIPRNVYKFVRIHSFLHLASILLANPCIVLSVSLCPSARVSVFSFIHILIHWKEDTKRQGGGWGQGRLLTRVPRDLEEPLKEVTDIDRLILYFFQLVEDGTIGHGLLELVIRQSASAAAQAALIVHYLASQEGMHAQARTQAYT